MKFLVPARFKTPKDSEELVAIEVCKLELGSSTDIHFKWKYQGTEFNMKIDVRELEKIVGAAQAGFL